MKEWNIDTDYSVGEKVVYNDKVYQTNANIKNGSSDPELNYDWVESFVNVSDAVIKPYVESISKYSIMTNTISEIFVYGSGFDDTVEIQLGDYDITIIDISPTRINFSIRTGNTPELLNLHIMKSGVKHFGFESKIEISDVAIGDGPTGTFITDFGAGYNAPNWDKQVFGAIISVDSYFKTSATGTPTGGTGPSTAYNGNYLFVEASNPNNGAGNYGIYETSYFRDIQSLRFHYHMFGSNINGLYIEYFDGVNWLLADQLIGQQQTTQAAAFVQHVVDFTSIQATKIRFRFGAPNGYSADIAIDNIIITSI